MKKEKRTSVLDVFTEEIIHAILDHLNDEPLAKKAFSLCCKSFYFIESRHRKSLKPLRSELLHRTLHRYPSISHLDLTLCPRISDATLTSLSATWHPTLRSINLSRSRDFTGIGLLRLSTGCSCLVQIDLSNGTDLTDSAAKAIAEAKNLEKLWLARCKLITDIGIGCLAVGCRKLRLLCLRWCLRVTDLGVGLVALKCNELRSLDLSCLPVILCLFFLFWDSICSIGSISLLHFFYCIFFLLLTVVKYYEVEAQVWV